MIILPATFDRESRGQFFKFAGETFQMCVAAGMSRDEARQFAIEYTNEKIRGYEQISHQHA